MKFVNHNLNFNKAKNIGNSLLHAKINKQKFKVKF